MNPQRLIVVSNRLPVTLTSTRAERSSGGLVAALQPLVRDAGGHWVGWTGSDDPNVLAAVPCEDLAGCTLVPVHFTPADKRLFYDGCSNEAIWPLFHDFPSRCRFEPAYWNAYTSVTEKFADAVERVATADAFLWVHDYHLMLLARSLRAREVPGQISYFHHIPFPAPDIFDKLPWRDEILSGLLHFDHVGFQTARDRQNFIACVRRRLPWAVLRKSAGVMLVEWQRRLTSVGVHPISVDYRGLSADASHPGVGTAASRLKARLGEGTRLVLGVDRLDYTKGIPERLHAFAHLLSKHPQWLGRVTMLQLVVPSREEVPGYQELKAVIEGLVSRINGEFATAGWVPVQYLHRSVPADELLAMYRAADVAMVTPLRDGMNLVAKEFCAARVEEDGVLLLSEFAGCAEELSRGALVVNPYDQEALTAMLNRALNMDPVEQCSRMRSMRACIREHDIFRWSRSFFGQPARTLAEGYTRRPVEPTQYLAAAGD